MHCSERFIHDWKQISDVFPKLKMSFGNDSIILSGILDLFSNSGDLVDTYSIEIHSTVGYPYYFPKLFETGGRLPNNINYHVYSDGSCCLATPAEERVICSKGMPLKDFLLGPVTSYFFNQTFKKENGYFFQERSHGLLGKLDYYRSFFNLKTLWQVKEILSLMTSTEPKSNSKCFCGSAKQYRKCHRNKFRLLKNVAFPFIKQDLLELNTILENHTN